MKTNKKELRKTALKLLPAIYSDAMRTGEESGLFQHENWRTGLCLDAFLLAEAFESAATYRNAEPQPQLKQLDQSVFDGLDEKWRFAAVDEDGDGVVYDGKPALGDYEWLMKGGLSFRRIKGGYDATNWQNSLIERDTTKELLEVDLSSELTGSDLARAMLARGDKYVMCLINDNAEPAHHNRDEKRVVYAYRKLEGGFCCIDGDRSKHAAPINNQGEPLTASEVGL